MAMLDAWPGADSVIFGFTGRAGGVSRGSHASLNLSSAVGDDEDRVRRNWQILLAKLPAGTRVARLRQVHGNEVRIADRNSLDLGDGDAAITADPLVAVAVLTADCVPILLNGARGAVVAAVHAGWRGTAADVAGATVAAIHAHCGVPPSSVEAIIGPAIGPCCYEVGAEVIAALQARLGADVAANVVDDRGHAQARVDLRAANRALLQAAGVPAAAISEQGPCTRCAAQRYFSHRAAAGGPTGRQAAIIARVASPEMRVFDGSER